MYNFISLRTIEKINGRFGSNKFGIHKNDQEKAIAAQLRQLLLGQSSRRRGRNLGCAYPWRSKLSLFGGPARYGCDCRAARRN